MLQFHRLKLLIVAISLCVGGLHAATLTDNDNTNFTITGEINLAAPNLSNANLIFASLYNANLNFANLSNATLSNAILNFASLYNANLNGADLSFANLSGAYLIGADLNFANLSGADLSGAFLIGADLSGARFQNTLYDSSTTFDNGFNPTTDPGLVLVPEPSSTALLGLGGLALMLRRRR